MALIRILTDYTCLLLECAKTLTNCLNMFCYKCGEKNKEIANFCKKCGIKIVIRDSILNTHATKNSPGFLGSIFKFFVNLAEYTAQIVISAIMSFAVIYGLIWAWARYGSQN